MTTTHLPETNFGTVTSWLPLTTVFPYQSDCSSSIWARWGFIESLTFDAVAFDPGYGITVDPAVVCMPSQVTLWWETETAPTVNGVATRYSVGPIACPEAFTTAGTSVVNSETTQVICCPSGYAYQALYAAGVVGECASPVSQGQVITYVMEKTPGDLTGGLITTSTTMANVYHVLGVPVNGFNFAASTTSTSTSSSSSSSSSLTTTASSSTSSISPTKSATANGGAHLIMGVKAGIGVAAALAGIAFIILSFLLFIRRRKYSGNEQRGADYSVHYKPVVQPGQPLPVLELHDVDRPHEIGTYTRPSELG